MYNRQVNAEGIIYPSPTQRVGWDYNIYKSLKTKTL
jgi:hypothetical protein